MKTAITHNIVVTMTHDEAQELRTYIDNVGVTDDQGTRYEAAQNLYSDLIAALKLTEASQ